MITSALLVEREDSLTEKNWKLYASRHYQNPQSVGDEEFEQDMKRLKYVKKALTRYKLTGELCERLILNHLIVLCNVLGPRAMTRLVFLKMPAQLDAVKPFLVMLNVLPDRVQSVGGRDWRTDEIPMDSGVVRVLRRV